MSKIGRASRNASLLRVETLDGTANKTIASAESGEVYILGGDPAAPRTITLPAAKAGAYFKFIVSVEADTSTWIIKTEKAGVLMKGSVLCHVDDGDATTDVTDNGDDVQLTLSADTNRGTVVEVLSDGTSWFATGVVICSVAPVFA